MTMAEPVKYGKVHFFLASTSASASAAVVFLLLEVPCHNCNMRSVMPSMSLSVTSHKLLTTTGLQN